MLVASNFTLQNPFDIDRVPSPSARSGQKRPTEMVDFSLVKEIIARAVDTTPKGLRDKAVLAVLFGGGLRRSELTRLRLNDVCESSQGTVFLRLRETKGKRDADQALPPWAAKIVRQLLENRVHQGAERGDFLFVSYRGRAGQTPSSLPVSDTGVYLLFKYYCQLAGAGPHVTPHSARATAITKLLADGIPHRQVQEFSRHSSIQMVELYDKRRLSVEENPAKGLTFE
jgi:integrase